MNSDSPGLEAAEWREAGAETPIQRAHLHETVADRIRARVLAGRLPPGSRIDELRLASELGVSRTPLREALKVLAVDALVNLAQGRGAFVADPNGPDVEAMLGLMALLEGQCAREAAPRIDPAGRARLIAARSRLQAALDASEAREFDAAYDSFQRTLEALAANPWLSRTCRPLRDMLALARAHRALSPATSIRSLGEIVAALLAGDAERAAMLASAHRLSQRQSIAAARLAGAEPELGDGGRDGV